MSRAAELDSALHVLTLTPFFPSDQNEVNGCFIAEPVAQQAGLKINAQLLSLAVPEREAT